MRRNTVLALYGILTMFEYVKHDQCVTGLLQLSPNTDCPNIPKIFNVYVPVHLKNILIYVQQDATLHSLLYLETALHVSGSTTTHHQERKQLYLQHLVFVRPLLLPAASVR